MLPYICSTEDHRRYIRRQKFGKNFSGILGCAALLLSKLSATGNHFVEQILSDGREQELLSSQGYKDIRVSFFLFYPELSKAPRDILFCPD